MTSRLSKVKFSADLLGLVQGFNCGEDVWEREVGDWIQKPLGQGGALDELDNALYPLAVWLHFNERTELVGYSSLGQSNWPQMPKISIVPNVAIATAHQGQGYFREIIGHLVSSAADEVANGRLPMLGLYVDPRNQKAVDVYLRFGFERTSRRYTDHQTGVVYQGMLLRVG